MGGNYKLRCIFQFRLLTFISGLRHFLLRHKPRPFHFGGVVQMIEDMIILEFESQLNNNNNNNCLKSNIQCIEIRVQWTVHLGSSHIVIVIYK